MLNEHDDPMHISRIVNEISKHREINAKSVRVNLKVDEYKRFKFFNCYYIGLENKEYDEYWYKIPRINPGALNFEIVKAIIDNHFFVFIEQKYGYPQEHIKYLVKNRMK